MIEIERLVCDLLISRNYLELNFLSDDTGILLETDILGFLVEKEDSSVKLLESSSSRLSKSVALFNNNSCLIQIKAKQINRIKLPLLQHQNY